VRDTCRRDAAQFSAIPAWRVLFPKNCRPPADADEEDAPAVLGNNALRVDGFVMGGVAERFGEWRRVISNVLPPLVGTKTDGQIVSAS
jgi:hypothetical protein